MAKNKTLIENYTEEEIKEMWKGLFIWVVENRPEWLEQIIQEKKTLLKIEKKRGGVVS